MEITEDWVRGLTGWKPFKEGKAMAAEGRISGFKRQGEILQGTLREGKMNLRPTVKIAGPSDVRVTCGCTEHRATGGICAHAVAVMLSALAAPAASKVAVAEPVSVRSSQLARAPRAWEIRLSPRFESEWTGGRLSLRLTVAKEPLLEQDRLISSWLETRKVPASETAVHLRLSGPEIGEFLDLVAGHPRVEIDGRKGLLRVFSEVAEPLPLALSRLEGQRVILELGAELPAGTLVLWGDAAALASPAGIRRLPAQSADPAWHEQAAELFAKRRLALPLDRFLAGFDSWSDLFESPPPGWLGELRLAGAQPDFELEIDGSLELVEVVLKVRYPGLSARALPPEGEAIPGLPRLAPDGHLQARSMTAEASARARLLGLGFSAGSDPARFRMRGREEIFGLLADGLPLLETIWTLRKNERFTTATSRVHIVRPDIQERGDPSQSLVFELSFQTTGGKRIPGPEIRRILRGGKRSVRLASGAELVVSKSCEELVQPLVEELGIGRPDEPFQLSGASSLLLQNLREILANPLGSNLPGSGNNLQFKTLPNLGLNASLRPYQEQGSAWLAERLQRLGGALLADEMGLGKTLQTIASINHFKHSEPEAKQTYLVVAPTSLLGNWMAEFKRFAPGLETLLFHGPSRDKLRERSDGVDVVVTSYGTLVRDLAFHLGREYRLIVADEASLLRNPDAELSKALVKLKAKARLALTGTPVENRMQDLWSIFRFIAPGYLGNRQDFKERYEAPASAGGGAAAAPGLLQRLRLRVSPFVLRRTKDQVATDLPDKVVIDEWLDLADDQAALYGSLARAGLEELERVRDKQGEGAGRMHLLTLLLRLRQVCVDPGLLDLEKQEKQTAVKIERLLALLEERAENGLKTLVFSQFATNLRRIEERLPKAYSQVFRIDGSTQKRQNLVNAFQAAPGAAVFLISLKAGGYGLNLTAADAVIHMDPWWNPAVEAQATDRAHRIGQSRPVTVYRLLTRGTVEERVRRMQDQKRAVINAATGGGEDEAVPQNWTAEDMESLLR
ncbi:DEAD/DEAH box helicase [Haloferula sp. BvORR071]|uniref:DEAD/DEAH box helicase n=1 Tax=Haloferula sp. BvORR071 TaxID=1396141 RepID=UPI0006970F7F|nr:DEAD/DEAH box helicase [Haloferula sp. BvORR071]